jgi:hypothetical protein
MHERVTVDGRAPYARCAPSDGSAELVSRAGLNHDGHDGGHSRERTIDVKLFHFNLRFEHPRLGALPEVSTTNSRKLSKLDRCSA